MSIRVPFFTSATAVCALHEVEAPTGSDACDETKNSKLSPLRCLCASASLRLCVKLRCLTVKKLRRSEDDRPPAVAQPHSVAFDCLDPVAVNHSTNVELDAVDLGERIIGAKDDEVQTEMNFAEIGFEDVDLVTILDSDKTL